MTLEQQEVSVNLPNIVPPRSNQPTEADLVRIEIEAMKTVAEALVPLENTQRTAVIEYAIKRLDIYIDRDRLC